MVPVHGSIHISLFFGDDVGLAETIMESVFLICFTVSQSFPVTNVLSHGELF